MVANITDNDANVLVTESASSTDVIENGATDDYDVVLENAPTGTVTITISPDSQVSLSTTTLYFTTVNWSVAQTVTVTAFDDAVVEAGHTGTITHSAAGGGYTGVSIDGVVANITDDEVGSVTITESATSTDVTEAGGTDTYDVVLDLEPAATTTITMSSDSQATTTPATLTFTTANWSTPHTVTVSAVDDAVVELSPHTGTISHTASGGSYDGVSISNVVANITDDDASVTITETGGSTDITEGGATDTYDVVLDKQPAATTTITITADSQATTSPATLTFTTSNWATPQTVTVTAVDDAVVELNTHPSTITHSANGGGYDSAAISNVGANITDNDASVTITETGGSTDITEGGATDTYDVVLDKQPAATTTITITADAQSTTTPATLTFTTSNWAIPQSVTVTAVDDTDVKLSPHTSTITHSGSGGGYESANISNVVANVTDDDVGNLTQLDYRWYDNADAIQPTTALAAENTAISNVDDTDVVRLRINIANGPNNLGAGATFKLQFSTATSAGWTDVGATSSSAIWRGFDNASVADGTTITTNLIGSSSPADKQTYEEQNDATGNALAKNKNGEFDWVVQHNGAQGDVTYYFRVIRGIGTPLEGYTNYPSVTTSNHLPDAPTSLGPAAMVDDYTGWTNDNTPALTFTLSDYDAAQQVRYRVEISSTSTFATLDVDYSSDLQAQGGGSFEVGQSGGSYAVGSPGMTLADNGTGYFWRVSTEDELSATSSSTIVGSATTSDFRIDTALPSAGTVNDGTGADIDFNDGSLTTMSANWTGFTDALSGIDFHEYSVGTTPGATDIYGWTNVFMGVNVTNSMLVLHTGQTYYFNVRVTDSAGNTTSSVASDGQGVLPTLAVTVSSTDIQLGNFGPDNNNTASTTMMISISTNAYQGYTVLVYAADYLRSLDNPAVIVPDFSAGTYDSPAEWSGTGWGFNIDDCDLNGGAFWTGAGCTGNPKYAPITQTAPGNVVGDHTALVDGSTGPVSDVITLTLRATTSDVQEQADYSTSFVVVVKPVY